MNKHNLAKRLDKLIKSLIEIMEELNQYKEDLEAKTDIENLKNITIKRMVFLGKKIKEQNASMEEIDEHRKLNQWIDIIYTQPLETVRETEKVIQDLTGKSLKETAKDLK